MSLCTAISELTSQSLRQYDGFQPLHGQRTDCELARLSFSPSDRQLTSRPVEVEVRTMIGSSFVSYVDRHGETDLAGRTAASCFGSELKWHSGGL